MTATPAEKRDTIVLGASAGGIEALQRVLPAFTARVEASVFVVQHTPAGGQSILDTILGRVTEYEVSFAQHGEVISPRHVYIAPPDQHLLIEDNRIRLWHGPRENRSRPAIDPLFRSAGASRRGRVMGGVLSGMLDDGSAGLLSVKRCGGLAFTQSLSDATESEMPERAADALGDSLDGALSAEAMGARMAELVGTPAPAGEVPIEVEVETQMMLGEVSALELLSKQGPPLPVSCPECGGPLWGISDGRLQRFRCHTGHTYGLDSFLSAQGLQIEQALWAAIKGLEQRSQVLKNLAKDENMKRRPMSSTLFDSESTQLRAHAQILRDVVVATYRDTHSKG